MTHDELLAKIESNRAHLASQVFDAYPSSNFVVTTALRSVVELHKPVQGRSDIQTYDYIGCDACFEWSHDGNMNVDYPCPTIQAIEKELG
jgi:hypothetical protein